MSKLFVFTEESLDDLDTFLLGLSSQISTIDEELSKAIQAQSYDEQSSKVHCRQSLTSCNIDFFLYLGDWRGSSCY